MTKKRWTIEDKAKIVMESLTTSASTADICKKYGLSPNAFYPWRKKFLEGGKAALAGSPSVSAARAIQKENATLRTLVGEITLANDVLKKNVGGEEKMMAVQKLIQQDMSLNKALRWCGVTRKRWYYVPKAWQSTVNRDALQLIQKIREERPFYGTRRMAAELSRRLDRTVNRKLVRRVYKRMAGTSPSGPEPPRHAGRPSRRPGPTRSGRPTSPTSGAVPSTGGVTASTFWTSSPGSG